MMLRMAETAKQKEVREIEERRRSDIPIHSTGPVEAVGPVEITADKIGGDAAKVTIEKPLRTITDKGGSEVAAPTTTAEENKTSHGQRRINLIWESQQAVIASLVVGTVLYVSARITLVILDLQATENQQAMAVTAYMLLSNIINLVIGFYFGRTNHQKVGGVGEGGRHR